MIKNKQRVEIPISYNFSWAYGVSIKKIREDLDFVEKLGATDINITYGESYGAPYLDIEAVVSRLETDEEFEKRIKNFEAQQKLTEQRELKELERLQLKYKTA